jgi:4-hydroxy-tetrahydrodipicolinate reductase
MKLIIAGAAGRMGKELIKFAYHDQNIEIIGATESAQSPWIGRDIGELIQEKPLKIKIVDDPITLVKSADVIIDFTNPKTTIENSVLAAQARISHIIGTTGLTNKDFDNIRSASRHAVIVQSGNMSLGINILAKLTKEIASLLTDFDIEIVEMHHNKKVDAPSGTALLLGEAAAEGRKINLDENAVYERYGNTGARQKNTIGFSTIRGGDVVGEHTVLFAGDSEILRISHSALSRKIFVKGAMYAAKWSLDKEPGFYSMDDVLNIKN